MQPVWTLQQSEITFQLGVNNLIDGGSLVTQVKAGKGIMTTKTKARVGSLTTERGLASVFRNGPALYRKVAIRPKNAGKYFIASAWRFVSPVCALRLHRSNV